MKYCDDCNLKAKIERIKNLIKFRRDVVLNCINEGITPSAISEYAALDCIIEDINTEQDTVPNECMLIAVKKMRSKLETILALCEGNLLRKTRCDVLGAEIKELLEEVRGE